MKVQACAYFVPNANVISSSLRSSSNLTSTSSLKDVTYQSRTIFTDFISCIMGTSSRSRMRWARRIGNS